MRRAPILLLLLLVTSLSLAQNSVPAYILQLPDSVSDVFIADISTATIFRFEQTTTGINLGHATDTTITRSAAGIIAVEGNVVNPMTTIGDIVYGGASGTGTRLAAGATTEVLVGGGAAAPVWTTATGTGAPARGTGPTMTDPLSLTYNMTETTTPSAAARMGVPLSLGKSIPW